MTQSSTFGLTRRSVVRGSLAAAAMTFALAIPGSLTAAEPQNIDPRHFFTGRTVGTGELKIVLHRKKVTRTQSTGRIDRNGTLLLDQTVEEEGAATRKRQWKLRETGPGKFSGTISDAKGEVTASVTGNLVRISYKMTSGEKVEHWIQVAPDGRSAHNRMVISKFGMSVATLNETIRKTGD